MISIKSLKSELQMKKRRDTNVLHSRDYRKNGYLRRRHITDLLLTIHELLIHNQLIYLLIAHV